jgi:uncharacterized HhH-GPD family protein
VTLTDDPAANQLLADDANALLLGVLYDSQFATRRAFAIPLKLRERLGHLDMARLAGDDGLMEAFTQKPALHRFPRRCAELTQKIATVIAERYGGDAARIWTETTNCDELGDRLLALPAFGEEKTNWTVGMLGRLGMLPYDGWRDFRVVVKKPSRRKPAADVK